MGSVNRRKERGDTTKATGPWVARWKDESGRWRTKAVGNDHSAAKEMLSKLETEAMRARAGIISTSERNHNAAAATALQKHIDDYVADLKARGNGLEYCVIAGRYLERVFALGKIETLREFLPERVRQAVAEIRKTRAPRTANTALNTAKRFATWMERVGRIDKSPLKFVEPYSIKIDRKKVRRSLTGEELTRLIVATEAGETLVAASVGRTQKRTAFITGPDRAMLYRVACETGLRAKELRSLTPESFRLDSSPPVIVVEVGRTKNDDEAVQPIRPTFAAMLKKWLDGRPDGKPVFVFPREQANMLKKDLKAAGIEYRTKEGDVDFHALRVSFASLLIRTGANIKVVQELMRHSTPTLTLAIYTKVDMGDKSKALEKLPWGE